VQASNVTQGEDRLRTLAIDGQYERCFEEAIERYGAELLGFLASMVGDEEAGRELYSQLCEDLWKALPAFEWRASFRTWAYVAARNGVHRFRAQNARHRQLRPITSSALDHVAYEERSRTAPHLRTENKSKLAELRETLEPEERMILVLRLDRGLDWHEVAEVIEGRSLADAERARAAATMRKRFERIKERLRALAEKHGLLQDDS
jgi:RNA polymerase sigma-70 factor, ECF subfamily